MTNTNQMSAGFSRMPVPSVKKYIWMAGIPLILILAVFGLGLLSFCLVVSAWGETDREIMASLEQKYTGKEISLVYEENEYIWNGEFASGSVESLSMEQVMPGEQDASSVLYSKMPVMVDGAEEEYLIYQKADSQNLYVMVNNCELDVLLEMEPVQ